MKATVSQWGETQSQCSGLCVLQSGECGGETRRGGHNWSARNRELLRYNFKWRWKSCSNGLSFFIFVYFSQEYYKFQDNKMCTMSVWYFMAWGIWYKESEFKFGSQKDLDNNSRSVIHLFYEQRTLNLSKHLFLPFKNNIYFIRFLWGLN